MDFTSISDAAPALGGLLGAIVSTAGLFRGSTQMRKNLKADADIAAVLPDGPERRRLLGFVSDQIEQLIAYETEASRDWPVLVFSVAAAMGLGAGTVALLQHGTWWSYILAALAGFTLLVFIYGIWETGQKVKRDEKGNRVTRT